MLRLKKVEYIFRKSRQRNCARPAPPRHVLMLCLMLYHVIGPNRLNIDFKLPAVVTLIV